MAADSDLFLGCNLPPDAALTGEGWEWRCNADESRAREMMDTYRELGFEVRLHPVATDGLSESCAGCAESLCTLSAVYVRKRSTAAATETSAAKNTPR